MVRDPEDVQLVRTQSDLDAVLDMLASAAGSGTLGLDAVAAAVEAEVASGTLLLGTRDADLDWLTGCIQALRAKTVEAKLALQRRARSRSGGRRVLQNVYEQGHGTGLGFEYTPGIGQKQ